MPKSLYFLALFSLSLIREYARILPEAETEEQAVRQQKEHRLVMAAYAVIVLGAVPWFICDLAKIQAVWPERLAYGLAWLEVAIALVTLYKDKRNTKNKKKRGK